MKADSQASIDHPLFWQRTNEALLASVRGCPEGLTTAEALERCATFGPNIFRSQVLRPLLGKLAKRIFNPLIAILIVAAAVSAFTGDIGSFVIITIVIALSITLDIVQEHRAEQAAERLRQSVAIKTDVRRNGAVVAILVEELVPGDVVELKPGDIVPADGVVLQSTGLQVNESLMTGEPFPVSKRPGPSTTTVLADAHNGLFAGTSVVAGSAAMLVIVTGAHTRFGSIAASLAALEPPTALEHGVHRLGMLILRLTIFLTLFVLLVHVVGGRPPIESFLFSVALAVGLTPELLPMIMTVTLAHGAQRMAACQVIVKRLSAIHDLGAMDVLCTDKTGTLTEAKIKLTEAIDPQGCSSERVLRLAALNSRFGTGQRSPLDQAALDAWGNNALTASCAGELPFDFERRCMSVVIQEPGSHQRILITKGAPESVIARSVSVLQSDSEVPIDLVRDQLQALQEEHAAQGLRLLAVATKSIPASGPAEMGTADESGLTLTGFCAFSDPPKSDARPAIAGLRAQNIRLKVISGDHPAVVRHVAGAVGLRNERVMSGREIGTLTDIALAAQVDDVDLFARVDPDQKTRLVKALRSRGHIVGFLGDGVNDAPAIHAAHVGLSVNDATDVARAAADMILLAPDLGVLSEGVREGRRTFANILKYVRMGTSSNFGNMLSMAMASLVLPFLPLLPLQILLNNLLYDVSEVGIPFDNVDASDLARPDSWDMKSILRFTIIMGAVSSLFDVITFAVLMKVFGADAQTFQTAWFAESMATQILVIFLIRTTGHAWKRRPHWMLTLTSLGALAASVLLITGPWRGSFGFVALGGELCGAIVVIVASYLAAAEAAKKLALRPNVQSLEQPCG